MSRNVEKFIEIVSQKNRLQKKYLKRWEGTEKEKKDLENLLNFYISQYHYSLDYLAESYLFLNSTMMEEERYFYKHGKYRNSSFQEVNRLVYQNSEYMERYMCGLAISDYIWMNHIKLLRYFETNLYQFTGDQYLEIGPGFGQYFIKAIQKDKFKKYLAVDISPTSVQKSRDYLQYHGFLCGDQYDVRLKDFLEFTSKDRFDCIVMGEVLEHMEQPEKALEKICFLLRDNGKAFLTTAINSPALDHIYHFPTIKSVLDMVEKTGFVVEDSICAAAGNVSLEKAEKIKSSINIGMILGKREVE